MVVSEHTGSDSELRYLRLAETGMLTITGLLTLTMHWAFLNAAGGLFRDEVHELHSATQDSLGDIVDSLWLDSSPLLYKLFLRAWASFTTEDFGLRLSALVIAILYMSVLLVGCGRLGARPHLSLALPVLAPAVLLQFDSLRGYGLAILFASAFGIAFVEFFESRRRASYVAATLLAVLAAQTSYYTCFFILAVCSAAAAIDVWKRDIRLALGVVTIGVWPFLSVLPYLPYIRRSAFWIPTQQSPFPFPTVFGVLAQAGGAVGLSLMAAAACAAVWYLRSPCRGAARTSRLAMLGGAIFFTVLTLVSFYSAMILPTAMRYTPLLSLVAVCLDLSLRCGTQRGRAALGLLVTICSLLSFPATLDAISVRQTNADLVARQVAELAGEDDLVLMRSWTAAIAFCHYYSGTARVVTIPNVEDHWIHRYDLLRERFGSAQPLAETMHAIDATLKSGDRIFAVGNFLPVPLEPVIEDLGPGPHPGFGWYKGGYLWHWEAQVWQHVLRRAQRGYLLPPATNVPVSHRENLPLRILEGYRSIDELEAPDASSKARN